MITVLYLTDAERAIWRMLSQEAQEGWTIEPENGNFRDSPQRREMRLHLLKLRDPKLLDFQEKAKKANTMEALTALILTMDLKNVNDADVAELFFAIGPGPIGRVVESILATVTKDEDIEGVAALTLIRRSLYQAMTPT
ncbi:MAG: hypothetical protein Greene101449_1067 [Candidatus Peregrinibacteria bacterium Greene1014_49]|nr:MAG: hypothetical protein Greene101449_1067 [Candidatus Peregrinibacteria bacterium Greene1014_49]